MEASQHLALGPPLQAAQQSRPPPPPPPPAMPPEGQPAGGEEKRCTHCGSSHTAGHWRHHPTSGHRLCGACAQYADKHSGLLPPDSVLQRRPAQPRRMADVRQEMAQRRCLHCGSSSPGGGKWAQWTRHPATGEGWLCATCYQRASRQLKKQRRQAEAAAEAAEEEQQPGHSRGDCTEEIAQRCLQCGSASPGGRWANWSRHPATGEEWLCRPCYSRISRQLREQRRQQAEAEAAEGKEQPGHSIGEVEAPEGEQAPSPQPLQVSRKRRQERQGQEDVVRAAFHAGPGANANRWRPDLGSSGSGRLASVRIETARRREPAPQSSAQRRQRRKQARPQHLPRQDSQQDLERKVSLAPTLLVGAAQEPASSQGPAAASLHGTPAAAGEAAATAGLAASAGLEAGGAQPEEVSPATQQHHGAGQQAGQQQQQQMLSEPAAEQDLFDLLQQAMDVAAAAASGLTLELVAAFAMLPPIEARRVSTTAVPCSSCC